MLNRLSLIASKTKGFNSLVDVGSDHAYVPIYALKDYSVSKAYALDISYNAIKSAIDNISKNNLSDKIETFVTDGLVGFTEEVDCLVISGMGGILITEILKASLDKVKKFKKIILGPNVDAPIVRRFLYENHFEIIDEDAIYDQNHYYEIICAKFSPKTLLLDDKDINYGPILRTSMPDDFVLFYKRKMAFLEDILVKISNKEEALKKQNELDEIKKMLNQIPSNKVMLLGTSNYFTFYPANHEFAPCIVVAPGGAYYYTSSRESGCIQEHFNNLGYHVVVVNYRETLDEAPMPDKLLNETFDILFKNKETYKITKIIGMGFSAGGHVILSSVLHKKDLGYSYNVDGLVLCYPVVSTSSTLWHKGSFQSLLGSKIDDEDTLDYYSLEKHITADIPPTFIWHTRTDESVNCLNSIKLFEAYKNVGAIAELHIFPSGGHGLSLANEFTSLGDSSKVNQLVQTWPDMVIHFLKEIVE